MSDPKAYFLSLRDLARMDSCSQKYQKWRFVIFEDEIQMEGEILDSLGVQIIFCVFQLEIFDLSVSVR